MVAKDDEIVRQELIYPYRMEQLDSEYLRQIFSSYRSHNDKYASLRLCLTTSYGFKLCIGTAHLVQGKVDSPKGLLGKFYVSKLYRRSGYEERCLIEIMKFAFEVMAIEKLIVFVNEQNHYFFKLLLYVGFRLIKMKPKQNGQQVRLMLSILRDEFDEIMRNKAKKIVKNKFYNAFVTDKYLENQAINSLLPSSSNNHFAHNILVPTMKTS